MDGRGRVLVPATIDPEADPNTQISHIYDNRQRIATRIKLLPKRPSLQPGAGLVHAPADFNIEVEKNGHNEFVVGSNFLLVELSVQAKHDTIYGPDARRIPFGGLMLA